MTQYKRTAEVIDASAAAPTSKRSVRARQSTKRINTDVTEDINWELSDPAFKPLKPKDANAKLTHGQKKRKLDYVEEDSDFAEGVVKNSSRKARRGSTGGSNTAVLPKTGFAVHTRTGAVSSRTVVAVPPRTVVAVGSETVAAMSSYGMDSFEDFDYDLPASSAPRRQSRKNEVLSDYTAPTIGGDMSTTAKLDNLSHLRIGKSDIRESYGYTMSDFDFVDSGKKSQFINGFSVVDNSVNEPMLDNLPVKRRSAKQTKLMSSSAKAKEAKKLESENEDEDEDEEADSGPISGPEDVSSDSDLYSDSDSDSDFDFDTDIEDIWGDKPEDVFVENDEDVNVKDVKKSGKAAPVMDVQLDISIGQAIGVTPEELLQYKRDNFDTLYHLISINKEKAIELGWEAFKALDRDNGEHPMTTGFFAYSVNVGVGFMTDQIISMITDEAHALLAKGKNLKLSDFASLRYKPDTEKSKAVYINAMISSEDSADDNLYVGSTPRASGESRTKAHVSQIKSETASRIENEHYTSARKVGLDNCHIRVIVVIPPGSELNHEGHVTFIEGMIDLWLDTLYDKGTYGRFNTQASFAWARDIRDRHPERENLPQLGLKGANRAWPLCQGFKNSDAFQESQCVKCGAITQPGKKRQRVITSGGNPLECIFQCSDCSVCKETGCTEKVHSRGLCTKHRPRKCTVKGCVRPAKYGSICIPCSKGEGPQIRRRCKTFGCRAYANRKDSPFCDSCANGGPPNFKNRCATVGCSATHMKGSKLCESCANGGPKKTHVLCETKGCRATPAKGSKLCESCKNGGPKKTRLYCETIGCLAAPVKGTKLCKSCTNSGPKKTQGYKAPCAMIGCYNRVTKGSTLCRSCKDKGLDPDAQSKQKKGRNGTHKPTNCVMYACDNKAYGGELVCKRCRDEGKNPDVDRTKRTYKKTK